MRASVLAFIGLAVICASADGAQQPRAAQWLAELNSDVWKPFMDGVRKDDEKLYLAVRSRDYVRVQAGANLILTHDDYVDDTEKMMRNYRDQGTHISIGRWRVLTDYFPASEPGLGEAQFMAAKPIEEFGGFLCYMKYPDKKQRCD